MLPIWIHAIITHKQPHFDEAVAIYLLQTYGASKFHGIRDAKILFWNAGSGTPDGKSAAEWEANGYLFVGVGGGRFDEHPTRTKPREQKECAATLVAKFLGMFNEPTVKNLLAYTYRTDATMVSLPGADRDLVIFGVANLSKLINRYVTNGNDQKALDWMMMAIEAYYVSQMEFAYAKQEFKESAKVVEVSAAGFQQPLKVSAITSDNASMPQLARSKEGNQSAVLIQQGSNGQVQIHSNTSYFKGLAIYDAVRLIRAAEILKKDPKATLPSWNDLAKEQAPAGAEEWFYQHSAQRLLNGSLTCPDAKPTSLTLEQIVDLVTASLVRNHKCGAVCDCGQFDAFARALVSQVLGLR